MQQFISNTNEMAVNEDKPVNIPVSHHNHHQSHSQHQHNQLKNRKATHPYHLDYDCLFTIFGELSIPELLNLVFMCPNASSEHSLISIVANDILQRILSTHKIELMNDPSPAEFLSNKNNDVFDHFILPIYSTDATKSSFFTETGLRIISLELS